VDTSIWSVALRRKAHELNPVERAAVAELGNLVKEGRAKNYRLGPGKSCYPALRQRTNTKKMRAVLRAFPDELLARPTTKLRPKPATNAGPEECGIRSRTC